MLKWSSSSTQAVDPTIAFRTECVNEAYRGCEPDKAWWLAVLELQGTSIDALAQRAATEQWGLHVPPFYGDAARQRTPAEQHVVVYVQRDFIRAANRQGNDLSVSRMSLGCALPEGQLSVDAPLPGKPTKVPDGSVIVAVIDSGIAFAHELFRLPDNTTRVHCAWIMDARPPDPGIQGRQLGKEKIDEMLARHTRAGLLDEEAFYREAGLIDFAQPGFKPASVRVSHGTHVMGLAAGFPPAENVHARPIICVQLPSDLVRDVTGSHLNEALSAALDFIIHCANRFEIEGQPGTRPPVAINFSFGNFSGPHDGTGVIERMLDEKLGAGPGSPPGPPPFERRMTLPAGNANLSRCHAEIAFDGAAEEVTLDWRVQADDRSASFVQLWMPWRPAAQDEGLVAVTVQPPGGPESKPVGASFGQREVLGRGNQVIGEVTFVKVPQPTDRGVVNISIQPTTSLDGGGRLAPAGLWKIRVKKGSMKPKEAVQAWIKRDETLPGFPLFGRQSYFDNPCYRRFDSMGRPLATDPPDDDCAVRRAGTLSGFACGKEPSVIAGYVESDRHMAGYSSCGPITPTRDRPTANRDGPDAAARSDDSPVARGVLSAGSRSGSLVAMSGTSVAAPQVAFWIANDMAAGQPGNRDAVRGKASADPRPPPPIRAGAGRMRLPRRIGSPRP